MDAEHPPIIVKTSFLVVNRRHHYSSSWMVIIKKIEKSKCWSLRATGPGTRWWQDLGSLGHHGVPLPPSSGLSIEQVFSRCLLNEWTNYFQRILLADDWDPLLTLDVTVSLYDAWNYSSHLGTMRVWEQANPLRLADLSDRSYLSSPYFLDPLKCSILPPEPPTFKTP